MSQENALVQAVEPALAQRREFDRGGQSGMLEILAAVNTTSQLRMPESPYDGAETLSYS